MHSSARQAGEPVQRVGVRTLVFVHHLPGDPEIQRSEAAKHFTSKIFVSLAGDKLILPGEIKS
jgi:ribonuclease BN (tRNA processing enzyme)